MLLTEITEATVWWVRLEFQLMDGAFLNMFIQDGEKRQLNYHIRKFVFM